MANQGCDVVGLHCSDNVRHHKSQHAILQPQPGARGRFLHCLSLADKCLFEVSPYLHEQLLQLNQVACGLLIHALLHAAQNLVG